LNLPARINKYFHNKSISSQLRISTLVIALISAIIIGGSWTYFESVKLKKELEVEKEYYYENKNQIVEDEVISAIDYIEYNRSLSQERMKKELKMRIDEAWNISTNIYNQNKQTKSRAEIEKMIKDAIRPIRFANERGDVFIYSLDGYAVLLPRSPHSENSFSFNYKDNSGNPVVRNEVNLLKQIDRGYLDYFTKSEFSNTDSVLLKSTYIRKFEPLGWYFGTKDYLTDFEKDLKEELLKRISKIRFDSDGYIFINSVDGLALISNGEKHAEPLNIYNSGDTNWISVFKEQAKLFNGPGKGYINYKFRRLLSDEFESKISYVGTVKAWGWIVGAGFYENEVENLILAKQAEKIQKRKQVGVLIFLILLIVLILIWFFSGFIVKKVLKSFRLFELNFRKSILESSEMKSEDLEFLEFMHLADSVNSITRQLSTISLKLTKEQSLLRSLIDSSPDLIFFKDLNSNYVGCNIEFSKYLGISENDLIGKNDFNYFSPESAERYHEYDRLLIKERKPIRSEEWITAPDGRKRLMDTFKVLYFDKEGDAIGIMAISRDITEREETRIKLKEAKERAEEADKLKTAFLANMSHEIRTPMNSIVGFSNLLTEDNLTKDEKNEYIQHINHGSETLLNLIDDIIDIAKIEAGQLSISPDACNLKELMDELYITHSRQLKHKNKLQINFQSEIVPLTDGYNIITDEFRLKQVMTNLIGNAIKFTHEGRISYGFRQINDVLEFYVSDTGIGISQEGQRVIFERFRQDNQVGLKHSGGTGLGLAISQHIIELLGGSISVNSSPGEGSVFSFTIPYKSAGLPKLKPILPVKNGYDFDWSDKTILVVEDIDSNYKYIHAAIFRTGIKILRAVDGGEAIDICKSNKDIDIILMDVNMPVMNGYDATLEIKKLKPGIPIIAQTAYAMQGEEQRSRDAGCDAYLSKPVNLRSLYNTMSQFIGERKE
jgi:PAS domain S-box-containing protein